MNPVDELAAVLAVVSGRRLDRAAVVAVLVEAALGEEGWLRWSRMPA